MKDEQLKAWKGDFGNAYIERNEVSASVLEQKALCWKEIFQAFPGGTPTSILEVGSNIGINLRTLKSMCNAELFAVEPNENARARLIQDKILDNKHVFDGCAAKIPLADRSVDMCFTSGVLIHISPDDLYASCSEIHRVARKYVLSLEYFANEPESKHYRGSDDLLFKRDFGAFWLENFHDLKPVRCGFFWKPLTGQDNLTWWLFEKS